MLLRRSYQTYISDKRADVYYTHRKSDGTFPTGGVGYPSTPTNFMVGMRDGDISGEVLTAILLDSL